MGVSIQAWGFLRYPLKTEGGLALGPHVKQSQRLELLLTPSPLQKSESGSELQSWKSYGFVWAFRFLVSVVMILYRLYR